MDPATHILTGTLLSRCFPKRKASLAMLVFAANAPDLDYITYLWGADVFLRYHRGFTHGIASLVLFSLLAGLLMHAVFKRGFAYFALISSAGYASHILLDLLNRYPVRVFSPFDWSKYSLDLLFVIDPYITGALLLGVILTIRRENRKRLIVAATMIVVSVYLTGRLYLKGLAEDFLRTRLDAYSYNLFPLPNDFLRWWFVTDSAGVYRIGTVDLFTRRVGVYEEFTYSEDEPEVRESKQLRTVKNFLFFSRFPLPEIERRGGEAVVTWRELSYSFLPGDHFIARVRFDRMGRAVQQSIEF
ncbi:MAG: metal-dependent hydrolase [Nitrospirae bacterium]|nr:metal-dependent hydrolase [Nitrospirota bacterium]